MEREHGADVLGCRAINPEANQKIYRHDIG
jgi:hypothetical protein